MKKGVMDLRKCNGPAIASFPHFYEADPSYGATVIGLNPQKEKHELYLLFETVSSLENWKCDCTVYTSGRFYLPAPGMTIGYSINKSLLFNRDSLLLSTYTTSLQ